MVLTPEQAGRLQADQLATPTTNAVALSAGLLTAVICYGTAMTLTNSYALATFCSPYFVGAIVGLFAYRRPVRASLQTILVALLLAVVTLREGVVCCLMAMPFVVPVTILGALSSSVLRRYVRSRRARRLLGLTLVFACVAWQGIEGATDDPSRHPVHVARSAIAIAAPPERVFATLSGDLEVRSDWPWFLRIGLPMPVRLTVQPPSAGGQVTAVFSQGVAHGHVTEWVPGRTLAYTIDRYDVTDLPFHITRLGRGPSYGLRPERVGDWLTILSTRWELAPRADGGTDLRREITWRRHLAPAFYFGWMQQTVIQRGQDRLLALVRERVQAGRERGGSTSIMATWRPDTTHAPTCPASPKRAGRASWRPATGRSCAGKCWASSAPRAGSRFTSTSASRECRASGPKTSCRDSWCSSSNATSWSGWIPDVAGCAPI